MTTRKNRPAPRCRARLAGSSVECVRSARHAGLHSVQRVTAPVRGKNARKAETAGRLSDRLRSSAETARLLRSALESAKFAGSMNTAGRIRRALVSATGAVRHLDGLLGAARRREDGRP